MGWLVIGYLGSLAVLLITAFWTLGELSGEIQRTATLDNFRQIAEEPVYRDVAQRTILIAPLGLHGPGYGIVAVWLVMSYLWLPYMVIPVYAGLERIPGSLLNASEDLRAKPAYTFRRVILPLVFPAVVAGSIFTFSLTLGDFIAPSLVGSGDQFIGTVVYSTITTNLPLAAAFATVPIVVMVLYLLLARRLGAFEHV